MHFSTTAPINEPANAYLKGENVTIYPYGAFGDGPRSAITSLTLNGGHHVQERRDTGTAQAWLSRVEAICAKRGLLITPLRRQVLEMLAATDAPLGAYAVLEELSKVQGKAVGPTTAYRTLDFFVENGIALKIASRNAYARCDHLGHHHHGALLICSRCGRTHEVDSSDLDAVVLKMASAANFKLEGQSVEIQGLCESCAGVG